MIVGKFSMSLSNVVPSRHGFQCPPTNAALRKLRLHGCEGVVIVAAGAAHSAQADHQPLAREGRR